MAEDQEFPTGNIQELTPTDSQGQWKEIYAASEKDPFFHVMATDILAGVCKGLFEKLVQSGISLPLNTVEIGSGIEPFAQRITKALSSAQASVRTGSESDVDNPIDLIRGLFTKTQKEKSLMRVLLSDYGYGEPSRRVQALNKAWAGMTGYSSQPLENGGITESTAPENTPIHGSNGRIDFEITLSSQGAQRLEIPETFDRYILVAISVFNYLSPEETETLLSDTRIRAVVFVNGPGLGSTQAKYFFPKNHEQIIETLTNHGFTMLGEVVTQNSNPQNTEFAKGPISGGLFIRPENDQERAQLEAVQPTLRNLDTTHIPHTKHTQSTLEHYGLTGTGISST